MADDPKQPHAPPPLADKGDARPLTHGGPGENQASDPSHERRPSGLHTRPDLYGARAVIHRPAEDASPAASDPAESGEGREPEAGRPAASIDDGEDTPDRNPSGPAGESQRDARTSEEAADRRAPAAPPASPPMPAANLLDHPLPIPESLSFEDWPGGPESESEPGARAPEAVSSETSDPDPVGPEASGDLADDFADESDDDLLEEPADDLAEGRAVPGGTPIAADAEAGRAGRLLAWMGTEGNARWLSEDRRPMVVAAASCGVLLLAALIGGVIGLPGNDRDTMQQAQGLDRPTATGTAPEDTTETPPGASTGTSTAARPADEGFAEASPPGQPEIPLAPAGAPYGNDRPLRLGGDRAGPFAANQPDSSQLATLPDSRGPGALDQTREPIVDFMRIDPNGKAVVAGRAAPGTELIVLDNGRPLGDITADIYGLWTFVSKQPLATGRHEIGLRVKRQGSEVSDPTLVTDSGSEQPQEPEAAPGAPVGGDEAALQASAERPETAAQEPAESSEPAAAETGASEPSETETGKADQPAESTGPQPASTVAAKEAPAPAAKPEPPAETQTAAAVPAGGDYVIQLASFKNPETAVREQSVVEERFSDLLAGHDVFVQQVDLAGQGTFYRVRLGPFANLSDARAACARFQERDRECLAMAR